MKLLIGFFIICSMWLSIITVYMLFNLSKLILQSEGLL